MAAEDITESQPGVTPGVMAQAIGAECLGRCADCNDAQTMLASANALIDHEQAAIDGLEAWRQRLAAELAFVGDTIAARTRTVQVVRDGIGALPKHCPGPRVVTVRNTQRQVVGQSVTCRRPAQDTAALPNGHTSDV